MVKYQHHDQIRPRRREKNDSGLQFLFQEPTRQKVCDRAEIQGEIAPLESASGSYVLQNTKGGHNKALSRD